MEGTAVAADASRVALLGERKAFSTETIFPRTAVASLYIVNLIYIELAKPLLSEARVSQCVTVLG